MPDQDPHEPDHDAVVTLAHRRPVDDATSRRANRADWDRSADDYQAEHGAFLGDDGFVWGPEGRTEDELALLGDVVDRDVLEIGAGAAQCSRWVAARGGRPVAVDLSFRQLQHARRIDAAFGSAVPLVQAGATDLPFADRSFDVAFASYGALPFVADAGRALAEVARVVRPGGRFVFSLTHPVRWAFPDVPGPAGLVASQDYWDETPYVEVDEASGEVGYVEHHRTLGTWVRLLHASGLALVDLVEPTWPATNDATWAGWSPLRGRVLPGTAIFVTLVAGRG
ncbi:MULTISPECIES: class I SAM-dependent methyltransferase [unclassified Nocardioides]|uniref:class I SAM-dependent methyltransferase n=1 Tax=unclassified Nocardioides TaxID=2615069 RepID=UPI002406D7C9|nr:MULTISPECIES: class I SAM-dependent methyltransferase [unclassified Nocardioides]